MRNRLIRKFTKAKEGTLGYTLMEMLVVIAIVVALLAIAIPSVVSLSKSLKFAQRNDYAKSIFMAAQANLTEMRADGGLAPLQGANVNSLPVREELCGFPVEDWSPEYVYTASDLAVGEKRDTYALVLPANSVDGTLRDQHVIIEYNPLTGNVYSVFYSEDDLINVGGKEDTLLGHYQAGNLPRNAEGDLKKRKDIMVGYYDGSGLSSSELEIERTEARIVFENGEEGIVTVMIPMPDLYVGAHDEFMKGLEVKLSITGEENGGEIKDILVKRSGTVGTNCKLDVDGKTVLVTYVLDSLASRMSFANLSAGTRMDPDAVQTMAGSTPSLTTIMNESAFTGKILPGENVRLDAEVTFIAADDRPNVAVQNANLAGVNPMFGYLTENLSGGGYTLTVENGRNLQNLNAIAPSVAKQITAVLFTKDIYWNQTVAYYNQHYPQTGGTFTSPADEAPARALPYFVPIHNENLFGTARFTYMDGSEDDETLLETILGWLIGSDFKRADRVPTLTDELDSKKEANGTYVAVPHAAIDGAGHSVYYLNINSNLYQVPNSNDAAKKGKFYATGEQQIIDYYFTGLFGYVNTSIADLSVVNPIVKGHAFDDTTVGGKTTYTDPATGALVGACGYNTYLYNCSVYLDTKAAGFNWNYADHGTFHPQGEFTTEGDQAWYGVSGAGAVGGLVGYAKSHRTTNGALSDDSKVLAFNRCFAAVPVSGTMRGNAEKDFGYSNGVGGLIGNSQLTNFYNCYASGNVRVSNTYYSRTTNNFTDTLQTILGLGGNGRLAMGGGGFVGTSHGTRYTNCFSASNVTRVSGNGELKNAGGFVGMMCYDETKAYGHHGGQKNNVVAQHTVFENCYAVGMCVDGNGNYLESFAGGTGTIEVNYGTLASYYSPDYYRLFAPYFVEHGADPQYQTHYVFKDSYYLSQYIGNANVNQDQSKKCANPIGYSDLVDLHLKHGNTAWIQGRIDQMKTYPLDAQVFRALINSLDDLFNKGGILGGLGNLWDIWNLFQKSNQNYEFYFTLYDYLVEEGVRPATPTLEGRYFARYSEGFPSKYWETPVERNTHYYGEATAGMVYPFPKINGLDYYGIWPAEPLTGGLAYYESYENADGSVTYGYYFDRADTSSLRSTEDTMVLHDGYAVFSGTKDDIIHIFDASGKDISGALRPEQNSITLSSPFSPDNSAYYVTRIPDSVFSNLTPGGDGFYSAIMIQVINGEGKTGYYWALFNPDTGISQVNNVQINDGNVVYRENPEDVMIRSARQLAGLSENSMRGVWTSENTTIIQQLHIDAAAYDWNNDGVADDEDVIPVLAPIGSAQYPFNATYSGSAGYVTQAKIEGFTPETALFGYVGNKGSIRGLNIQVEADAIEIGETTDTYTALLAAVCGGEIENVDLTLACDVTLNAKTAAGLLVGYVNGTEEDPAVITGCDITAEDLTVNAENAGAVLGQAEFCDVQAGVDSENLADDVTLTLNALALNATEAGGFLGKSGDLDKDENNIVGDVNLDGIVIEIPSIESNAIHTGTLVGTLEKGSIKNLTINLDGTYSAEREEEKTVIAGVAAVVKNATVQNVNVTIPGTITGDTAAGVFGTALGLTVQTTDVTITGAITGTEAAAGMAASIEGGSFTAASVKLSGTITANGTEEVTTEDTAAEDGTVIPGTTTTEAIGRAAGYAVAVKGQVESGLVIAENQGTITANAEAAGFACEVTAQVSGSRVAGKLSINGSKKAAGFAVKISGNNLNIGANGVTPALENTTVGYLGNSNANLTVNGETAALFAVEIGKGINVTNCYALGKVTGTNVSGFADVSGGAIDGCTANVTITGGNAFIRENTGSVSNSYGWYGNGAEDLASGETATVATMDGIVFSSYFVDLDIPALYDEEINTLPNGDKYRSAVVYDSEKNMSRISPLGLNVKLLNGQTGTRWFAAGTYSSFPFSKLVPVSYPFPMLRVHYGNWATPPRYAYGVLYYEQYKDGTWKLQIVDMSDPDTTVENASMTGYYTINGQNRVFSSTNVFGDTEVGNENWIEKYGYAAFYKDKLEDLDILNAQWGDHLTLRISDKTVYTIRQFSPVNADGKVIVNELLAYPEKDENGNDTTIGRRLTIGANYAHEFDPTDTTVHVVRTEGQLQKVAVTGQYQQTCDIILYGNFATMGTFAGTYDGAGHYIQKRDNVNGWMSGVSGTVQNVELVLGNLNGSLFGDVSGTVSLNDLYLASVTANGSLINTLSGTLSCDEVEIDGDLAGAVINTANATGSSLTVKPASISGTVIGTVAADKDISLTLNYGEGRDIAGSLVRNVNGTFTLAQYPAFGIVSGNLFENVSGTVNLGNGITVNTLSGSLVGTVSGGIVNTGNVTVTTLDGALVQTMGVVNEDNTVSGGTVNTGDITVTSLNASLVETFNGGTLSGTQVNVSNGITVPVFADELGSEAQINTYVVSGSVTLGANASGALVNTNNGTLDGLTLASGTVTVESAEDATIGVLVGTNTGDLTNCVVEGAAVTITGTKGKTLTFGGLVGENSGDITGENTEVEANITYIQPMNPAADQKDSATIGGLVGKMSGGTLNGAYVTGTIDLTNKDQIEAATAIAEAEAQGIELVEELNPNPVDPARSYIIGGAVGKDSGEITVAQYSGVTTNVHVNDRWGVNVGMSATMPAGRGAVGKFVGYVNNGVFTDCSATNSNGTYMFLGEIVLTTATLEDDSNPLTNWYTSASNENLTDALNGGKEAQGVYDSYGYTREGETYTYSFYSAQLSNCGFIHTDEIEYFQSFDNTYIYQGTERQLELYTANRFGTKGYAKAENLTVGVFGSGSNGANNAKTDYYYLAEDGIYYSVYRTYSRSGSYGNRTYTYTLKYLDSNEEYVTIYGPAEFDSTSAAYDGPQLYTATEAAILSGNAMYMIVSSDGQKTLDANDNAVSFQASFNREENADLYAAIWQTSGPKAQWQNVSNTGRYLYLNYERTWGGANITVTSNRGRNITVSAASYDNAGYALFELAYEQSGWGTTYYSLTYANGSFSVSTSDSSQFQIYIVSADGNVWKANFMLNAAVDQVIVTKDVNGNALDFTATTNTDLPADSGEAPEVPAATGSNETATTPPAGEDGNNN